MTQEVIWATGRRKTSIAQVRLLPGAGEVTVNGKTAAEYFQGHERHREEALSPLKTEETKNFNALIKVQGGGITGQAQAVRHGLARALVKANADYEPKLRASDLLTRDSRKVERKKYGQSGARKRFQYSKR